MQGAGRAPLTELFENRDDPGSTHFFFDIGNGNALAFFDFPGLDLGAYQEVLGGFARWPHAWSAVGPRCSDGAMSTGPEWKARPDGPEYELMRRRVVDAAEAIVRESGAGALRLDSVAETVGLHRSSVYRYVDSKEELLTAVVVQATLRLGRGVLARLGPDAPPERFLVDGLAMALASIANDPVHRSLMAPSASEAVGRVGGRVLTEGLRPLVEPMFAAAAAQGVLRAGVTPDDALQWLQIVATGLLRTPVEPREPADLVRLLELMLVPSLLEVAHLQPPTTTG